MQVVNIIGWILYVLVILHTVSMTIYIWRVRKSGGPVTYMGLFQWAFTLSCTIVFGLFPIDKLHILWAIPVGWIISFTSVGKEIGKIVGIVSSGLWLQPRSASPGESYVKEIVKEIEEERGRIRELEDLSDVEIIVEHIYKIQKGTLFTFRESTALAYGKAKSNKCDSWNKWGAFYEGHKWLAGGGDIAVGSDLKVLMGEEGVNRIAAAIEGYLNTHFPDGYDQHNKLINTEADIITADSSFCGAGHEKPVFGCPECIKNRDNL